MNDNVRHGQTQPDIGAWHSPLVTLDVVSRKFIAAGLPRSMRTLQRYCSNGTLDCVKEATETGDTFFVAEHSIETAITSLKQLHDAKDMHRHDATQRAVSLHDAPENSTHSSDDVVRPSPPLSDTDAAKTPDRQRATEGDTSAFVAQLEQRLGEKDEEIAFLREELIDRRGQIKDMKGIIDGQNQLLETIQTNVAPIFKALAATVRSEKIGLAPDADRHAGAFRDATDDGRQDIEAETNDGGHHHADLGYDHAA